MYIKVHAYIQYRPIKIRISPHFTSFCWGTWIEKATTFFIFIASFFILNTRFAPFTLLVSIAPTVSFVPLARFAPFIQDFPFVPAVLLVEPKTQHLVQHSRQFVLSRFRSDATQGRKVRFHLWGRFRYVRIVDGGNRRGCRTAARSTGRVRRSSTAPSNSTWISA